MGGRYTITGYQRSWCNIIGYQVTDEDNKTTMIKIAEAIKLVKEGKVVNGKLIKYNKEELILVNNSIDNLSQIYESRETKLEAVSRILSGDKLIGYILKDSSNKEYKLTANKVWELAIKGDIQNIKANIINNKKCLNGVDTELHNLPKITI